MTIFFLFFTARVSLSSLTQQDYSPEWRPLNPHLNSFNNILKNHFKNMKTINGFIWFNGSFVIAYKCRDLLLIAYKLAIKYKIEIVEGFGWCSSSSIDFRSVFFIFSIFPLLLLLHPLLKTQDIFLMQVRPIGRAHFLLSRKTTAML